MPGHHIDARGRSCLRVFAPEKQRVALVLVAQGLSIDLVSDAAGYWEVHLDVALPDQTLYWLEVDGLRVPDPASLYQPQGVQGPSMVVHLAPLPARGWTGVAMADAIVYELHVGTFTPQGTLQAARSRLEHLQRLGVTVIELMPLAAFSGTRNWGYDGTLPFALQHSYGSYSDLQDLITDAHARGMAVVLDVVFNHFGPEGHTCVKLAPYTKLPATPWGQAVNFDGPYSYGVRDYFLACVRHWIAVVGFDGLRMDAVSMIFDTSPVHVLRACTDLARAIGLSQGRTVLMVAEHLGNDRSVTATQGWGFDSQWSDDLNHAVFAHMTGETHHHYAPFGALDDVLQALRSGFVFDGTRWDPGRKNYPGTDGRLTLPHEHVVHIQNHDQVGNRARGDRLAATYGLERAMLGMAAVMASPFVPMLFMGEEYGETAPFLFFEDFADPLLVEAVRRGREAHCATPEHTPPDPHDPASFTQSQLQWHLCDAPQGQRVLAFTTRLIALKRSGALGPRQRDAIVVQGDPRTQVVRLETAQTLTVLNFSSAAHALDALEDWALHTASVRGPTTALLPPHAAWVFVRRSQGQTPAAASCA